LLLLSSCVLLNDVSNKHSYYLKSFVLTAFHTLFLLYFPLLHVLPLQFCSYRIFHSRNFSPPAATTGSSCLADLRWMTAVLLHCWKRHAGPRVVHWWEFSPWPSRVETTDWTWWHRRRRDGIRIRPARNLSDDKAITIKRFTRKTVSRHDTTTLRMTHVTREHNSTHTHSLALTEPPTPRLVVYAVRRPTTVRRHGPSRLAWHARPVRHSTRRHWPVATQPRTMARNDHCGWLHFLD